jgi:hypothetical protein
MLTYDELLMPVTFRLAWNYLNIEKEKEKNEREKTFSVASNFSFFLFFFFEFDERPWGLKWLYSLTRFGFLTDEPNGDATSG